MDFEFLDLLNPTPLVQKKKKYTNFHITPIGGPDEIIKWRQMQEAKETAYNIKLNSRVERIEGFEKELGQKMDAPKIHTSTWDEKLAFVESEKVRLAQAEKRVMDYPKWETPTQPKKSLLQRIRGMVAGVWKNANF